MKAFIKIIIVVVVLLISLMLLLFSYYTYQLTPPANDDTMIEIEIPKGATGNKVATILKDNKLIRNVDIFKIYLKIHSVRSMNYGVYELNKAMSVKQIIDIISDGKAVNRDIKILFKEGLNMRGVAKVIANNTNNSYDDVFDLLKDKIYINSLVDKYWFLEEIIKDNNIYYPLEGYLAPNTYRFASKDVTVGEIFARMLDQTSTVLTPYKEKIKGYTIHEFLTLASIVQSEGIGFEDMPDIAGVFQKRLDENWSLGSCVTACYAAKEDSCTSDNVKTKIVSLYNTYLSDMAGKLPIGPVSNPGNAAIEAAINPADNDYYFFLSDKYKKIYFSKTPEQHYAKQAELKASGNWYK